MSDNRTSGCVSVLISREQLKRLKEHIEGRDYCFLCDLHPRDDHSGHDSRCPLKRLWCEHGRLNDHGDACLDCGAVYMPVVGWV
jgi:hypothetical protein